VLLVGAGLFLRTLQNLAHTDPGFNPDSLLQVSLDTRSSGYRKGQVRAVYNVLLERIAAVPGVRSVSGIRNAVMRGGKTVRSVAIPGRRLDSDEVCDVSDVGPRFFETMGIPVMRGRAYEPEDIFRTSKIIVINDSYAKRYFPNEDPIGRIIGDPPGAEIIGLVKDSRFGGPRKEPRPMVYELALRGEPDLVSALEVRTTGDPASISQAVQQEVRRINPRLLVEVKTMRQEIDRAIAQERMVAATSAFFSALGLVLACIGLFGVASYTVAQRTNELGIRIALGANRWEIVRQSLYETVQLFAAGLIAGTVSAIVGVRFAASAISDLLFGLKPTDSANIAIAAALMVAVTIAACILPAYRATKVDPLMAIRYE
jgi:putative ABC transport system permease protein